VQVSLPLPPLVEGVKTEDLEKRDA
jgi:hypothetical protein